MPDYRLQRPFASVIVLTAIALSPGTEGYGQQREQARALLRMPIGPVRAPNGRIPLPEALKAVGASLLDGNYAIFGLEMRLKDGKEPTVKLKFERRGTLVEVLEQIMLQLPDYEIEFPSGHLVTIYPKGADEDPEDVLNLRVARFHVDGERAGTIFTQPGRFMPELQGRLTSGDSHAQGLAETDKPVRATAEGPTEWLLGCVNAHKSNNYAGSVRAGMRKAVKNCDEQARGEGAFDALDAVSTRRS